MLVLSLLVGGCGVGQGGASGQDEQSTQKSVVGENVETVSDKDAFVALVSEKPKEGEAGGWSLPVRRAKDQRVVRGPGPHQQAQTFFGERGAARCEAHL
jgi:hypothetical protein